MTSMHRTNGYRAALVQRFWDYRREFFLNDSRSFDQSLSAETDRPPVFLKHTADLNVLTHREGGGLCPWSLEPIQTIACLSSRTPHHAGRRHQVTPLTAQSCWRMSRKSASVLRLITNFNTTYPTWLTMLWKTGSGRCRKWTMGV